MESAAYSGFAAAGEIVGEGIALPMRPTQGLAGLVRRWSNRPGAPGMAGTSPEGIPRIQAGPPR